MSMFYIKTSINIPIPDEELELNLEQLNSQLTPKAKMFKSRGFLFSHVVIYDGNGEGRPARRLASALLQENKVRNVKIVQGGYQIFAVQYPFLCSSLLKKAEGGAYPSAIVDSFLYLGSHENAKSKQQLKDLGISHIINMAGELDNEYPNDFKYLSVKLDDTSSSNISEHFERTLQFIEEARAASSKVLVHCAMGISRSSSVVIAYLMHERGWSYEQAHEFVKSMRSCIKPNPGFMEQLVAFERRLIESQQPNQLAEATQALEAMQISPLPPRQEPPQHLEHIV